MGPELEGEESQGLGAAVGREEILARPPLGGSPRPEEPNHFRGGTNAGWAAGPQLRCTGQKMALRPWGIFLSVRTKVYLTPSCFHAMNPELPPLVSERRGLYLSVSASLTDNVTENRNYNRM